MFSRASLRVAAMAIFHTHLKVIARSEGRSVVAAAAYRAASRLHDERLGRAHDFRAKPDCVHSAILLPPGASERLAERAVLWNAVEAAEKRKDAQLAREVEFALPQELALSDNIELARSLVQEMFVARGMIADLNIHHGTPDGEGRFKPHCHVLLTMRAVGWAGFGAKQRAWNSAELTQTWRELLATRTNQLLAARGLAARVDHRTLASRGIELEPQPKIGPAAKAEARSSRGETAQAVAGRNGERIITRPAVALAALTEHQSTFTRHDLARFVHRHTRDAVQFTQVLARIEAAAELVRLGIDGTGEERFTSWEMLTTEQQLQEHADQLASRRQHGLTAGQRHGVATAPGLGQEQQTALAHLLRAHDLALLAGFAGTGKSRLLAAARAGWEQAGYRVRGVALSGIAAEGLEAGSGIASRTIASLEHAWKQQRDQLDRQTILVLDEAGMVGSRQLERVLAAARQAGAKVVLVGDVEQLQAIEAGAAFRFLSERHGAAQLTQVRRQQAAWMQAATRELATGRTAAALQRYAAAGMVHASSSTAAAQERLIGQWDFDRLERPERTQLILASTKADVQVLNGLARARLRAAGELAADHLIRTAHGPRLMAVGDRVMFLQNERGLGVKNGSLGTLQEIAGRRLGVRLDAAGQPGAGPLVRFDTRDYAQLAHGYAATIHKAQGVTVDRAYVQASRQLDRHATYVALTRQRGRVDLHYGQDAFGGEHELAAWLGRERRKDMALDHAMLSMTARGQAAPAAEVRMGQERAPAARQPSRTEQAYARTLAWLRVRREHEQHATRGVAGETAVARRAGARMARAGRSTARRPAEGSAQPWRRSAPATRKRSSAGSCCPASSRRRHRSAARRTCSGSRKARC